MLKSTINIFLTEPIDKSKYKTMMVFADNTEQARIAATVKLNPMQIKIPGNESPMIDPVYSNANHSACRKIDVEILLEGSLTAHIKYPGNEYHLTKDFAEVIND